VALCRRFSQICPPAIVHCSRMHAVVKAQRGKMRADEMKERERTRRLREIGDPRRFLVKIGLSHRDRAPRRAPPLRSSPPCWVVQQTISASTPSCARWRPARAWRERRERREKASGEREERKSERVKEQKGEKKSALGFRPLSPPLLSFSLFPRLRSAGIARTQTSRFARLLDFNDVTRKCFSPSLKRRRQRRRRERDEVEVDEKPVTLSLA